MSPIYCRTDLRITNHRGHKLPPSLNAPFIQNSNRMAFSVDCNREFFKRILSTPAEFKVSSKLFGSQDCSDDKKYLDFSSIFFAVSFHFTGSRSSQVDGGVIFLDQSQFFCYAKQPMRLLHFHFDNRRRQMAFFVFAEVGKGRLSSFEIKKL